MNIVQEIKTKHHGSRIAIQDGELELSFDALFLATDEILAHLARHAAFCTHALPRIGVRFPNGLGYILLAIAVVESGACFVPIPDELTDEERDELIRVTALHAVISPSQGESDDADVIALPYDLGSAKIDPCPPHPCQFPEQEFESLQPAFIRFSSGTTAKSKGVVLSHSSLLERITAANQGLMIAPGDRVLWVLPMAHHFAVSIILYLYYGATTVLETSHHPDEIYRAAQRSKTNLLYGSPFHFAQLAQCQMAAPLPDLRLAISTASALSEEIAQAFKNRFHLPLTQALGIIEVGLPILNSQHASDDPTALGQTLPDYEWKINASGGDSTSPVGELMLRGPGMFDAYLSPWQTRAQVTTDDWFATGDLVEEQANQTLIMRGRSKSVINVGGMKVFPEEIEAVLNDHPSIDRCRIFAKEHAMLGSYPAGEYVLSSGEKPLTLRDVREYCESRLTSYKIPIVMTPVKAIDLTASGKVKRHA